MDQPSLIRRVIRNSFVGNMMGPSLQSRKCLILGVSLMVLLGCSNPESHQGDPSGSEVSDLLQDYLNQAQSGGASVEQIAILVEAVSTGELTLARTLEAVDATLKCFEEAGIRSANLGTNTHPSGLEIPAYVYGASEGQDENEALNIADSCMEEHSLYVERAYQRQPSSVALEEAYFESRRPEVLACLRGNGITIDDDATRDEIERASLELLYGMTWEEIERAAREAQDSGGTLIFSDEDGPLGPDCLFDPTWTG